MWRKKIFYKNDSVVTRRLLDETILVPIKGDIATMQQIFSLNSVAVYIWEQLDGRTPLGRIGDKLVAEFDINRERAEDDLCEFVETLESRDLIREKGMNAVSPSDT